MHQRSVWTPEASYDFETFLQEVTNRQGFYVLPRACLALQVYHNTPSVKPLLLEALVALSHGLPNGDQLVRGADVDSEVIEVCPKLSLKSLWLEFGGIDLSTTC